MLPWFKDIPGHEGRYAVSITGDVYSYRLGRCMKLTPTTNGHLSTVIGRKTVYAHNLVLETFIGPRPSPDYIGRHLDGNPVNNYLFNLEWGTHARNFQDRKWHGPTRNYKLSVPQIREIKDLISQGVKSSDIAPMFGVTPTNINYIKNGKIHADV